MSWLKRLNVSYACPIGRRRLSVSHVAWPARLLCMVLTALLFSAKMAYGSDYQIEVIVFKRTDEPTPTHLEEPMSSSTRHWPENMISIAPQRGQSRVPFLWSQAVMLDADPLSSIKATKQDGNPVSPNPVFLLASESRADLFKRRIAQINPPTEAADDHPHKVQEQLRKDQRDALLEAAFFPTTALDYQSLDSASRQLNDSARSIRRSSLYELLLHQSWLQPIGQTPVPILIQGGEQYGNLFELEGTFSVRRQRYLHVETDLRLTKFKKERTSPASEEQAGLRFKYPALYEAARRGREYSPAAEFNLREKRRLVSGELHYFDHPALGVLLLIRQSQSLNPR